MRIIIDMQGAQADNKSRGIGRYTISIVKAIIRNCDEHEVVLVLNDLFPETIMPLRHEFEKFLPKKQILVWQGIPNVSHMESKKSKRRSIAELSYEAFLANQAPDFIYITSLFEGLSVDAITSIHKFQHIAPVAVTLYDLIPFINPTPYLESPEVNSWYREKIAYLKEADLWLSISESSRQEGINYLDLPEDLVWNISTDADEEFHSVDLSEDDQAVLRAKYGLTKDFLMYTGGIDHRKNVEALIRAYASLPKSILNNHQLAIVCAIQPESRTALISLIAEHGLKADSVVITGFVTNDEMLALYNLCKLFVFPSWHEGFGLPALEAMRCGAPVIGANTSSLPEVIGCEEALFDPFSEQSIADAIQRGLTDEGYRLRLIEQQSEHTKNFNWDKSARTVIHAMEQWHQQHTLEPSPTTYKTKPKLAFVSPLPPARSGISDYSAELLPELVKYYDIDLIVEQNDQVNNQWINSNLEQYSSDYLINNRHLYERVLYHFGNSDFHQHMFSLLEQVPGIVMLHDFYLSGIQAHRDIHGHKPNAWAQALLQSHGYKALWDRFQAPDTAGVVWQYPSNLPVLQNATEVIVHSQHSCELANKWYGNKTAKNWNVIPLLRKPINKCDKQLARKELGFLEDDIIVCSFGVLGKTKLNDRLLSAWLNSSLGANNKAHLIFVGQDDSSGYCQQLKKKIKQSPAHNRIKITGWAKSETFDKYLAAADIGVQLRILSRGETSAAVLDCMNYGLATIVNAHGSMADLNPEGVWLLPDEFSDEELTEALLSLASDQPRREQLGRNAQSIIKMQHCPEICAAQYYKAIESVYRSEKNGLYGLINELAKLNLTQEEAIAWSAVLAQNFLPQPTPCKLLVDISELVQRDAKSGIQRVVRAILQQWLHNPPAGFQVEPVYATADQLGYRYARKFTSQFMGLPDIGLTDDWVAAAQGDKFIGLDLQPVVVPAQRDYLKQWQRQGVDIGFVVYDLLPITLSEHFPPEGLELHNSWLEAIAQFDSVYCISEAVAEEFKLWFSAHSDSERVTPLTVQHFHLGADVAASAPSTGFAANSDQLLASLKSTPSFLMVGTLEPRKGHTQVLDAFECLWATGVDANLVIVGKQGWMVESLIKRLRHHPENGKRLFLLEGISDEYLEKVYANASCLVAASYGEGFGLPLIEAAQNKLPIIARDIPVFREVADEHAFYFDSEQPQHLAKVISEWLVLFDQNKHPKSDAIPWLSWQQSAKQLLNCILGGKQ